MLAATSKTLFFFPGNNHKFSFIKLWKLLCYLFTCLVFTGTD